MSDWQHYRDAHAAELHARGETPDSLQARYRGFVDGRWGNPVPTKRDAREQECAVIDALVEQGGIAAWHGDGVGCVAQMIDKQMERAEKAEAELAQARAQIAALEEKAANGFYGREYGRLVNEKNRLESTLAQIQVLVEKWREIASRPQRPTGFLLCADELAAVLTSRTETPPTSKT